MSRAFNACRRSFHIKLDVNKSNQSISIWLVERGKPMKNQQKEIEFLHSSPTVRFSSTLIEFEVVDMGLKNRKGSLFFSFGHERNQVIGYKNFAQLD